MSRLEHATDRRKLADAGQDHVDNVVNLLAKRAASKAAANSSGT
jgi:hypothetical protein